jgi:hypothetical protein
MISQGIPGRIHSKLVHVGAGRCLQRMLEQINRFLAIARDRVNTSHGNNENWTVHCVFRFRQQFQGAIALSNSLFIPAQAGIDQADQACRAESCGFEEALAVL